MLERLRRAAALAAAVTCLGIVPAGAQEVPTEPTEVGVFSQPVRFAGDGATTTTLQGDSRYGEIVELRSRGGEVSVINDVSMRTYVEGLAEVPFSWPMEALKAQVVAARTYAWFSIRQASFQRSGYDICDTTACQVYSGRDQMEEAGAERWRQAVAETEGEVIVHAGQPILARYFSTSGGRTRNNEEVFPNEGPRPYLKGVDDPDDAVSPLHRWQVRFPRGHFDEILSHGTTLSEVVPVADVRWIDPATGSDRVVVTGRNGRTVEVPASSFRSFVSRTAPELYPDAYPAPWPERARRYPTTLMSSRLSFELTEQEVIVSGRGWGHGVGMGQYGAMGKAERGMAYDDILAAYYNGLRPTTPSALPDRVRVGVDRVEGTVELRADRPVPIVVGERTITERGMGTWRVEPRGGQLALLAPAGFGRTLQVAATEPSRSEPYPFERITVGSVVNKPTEAALVVRDALGDEIARRELGIVDAGPVTAEWGLDGPDGSPVAAGEYEVELLLTDEAGDTAGQAAAVRVREPAAPGALASLLAPASPPASGPPWVLLVLAAAAGVVLGALAGRATPRPAGDRPSRSAS